MSSGAYVVVLDLQDTEDIVQRWPLKVKFYKTDVTNTQDIRTSIENIVQWGKELNVGIAAVVCCAGILGPAKASYIGDIVDVCLCPHRSLAAIIHPSR